jgi:hypothetical protein
MPAGDLGLAQRLPTQKRAKAAKFNRLAGERVGEPVHRADKARLPPPIADGVS